MTDASGSVQNATILTITVLLLFCSSADHICPCACGRPCVLVVFRSVNVEQTTVMTDEF